MKIISGIYLITFPNNKTYVGQSKNCLYRWNSHKSAANIYLRNPKKPTRVVDRAIAKYGHKNCKFEILKETYDRTYYEKLFILLYNSYYKNNKGYNLTFGGEINEGQKMSAETKIKISQGLKNSKTWQTNVREGRKKLIGRKYSDITKEKMSLAQRDRILSEETKEKIRNIRKGKTAEEIYGKEKSIEWKRKHSESLKGNGAIKIKCIQTGEIFNSQTECIAKYGSRPLYDFFKTGHITKSGRAAGLTFEKLG
jgi:group I intron endonuclease